VPFWFEEDVFYLQTLSGGDAKKAGGTKEKVKS
jgi:hypothetical protein